MRLIAARHVQIGRFTVGRVWTFFIHAGTPMTDSRKLRYLIASLGCGVEASASDRVLMSSHFAHGTNRNPDYAVPSACAVVASPCQFARSSRELIYGTTCSGRAAGFLWAELMSAFLGSQRPNSPPLSPCGQAASGTSGEIATASRLAATGQRPAPPSLRRTRIDGRSYRRYSDTPNRRTPDELNTSRYGSTSSLWQCRNAFLSLGLGRGRNAAPAAERQRTQWSANADCCPTWRSRSPSLQEQ
jgi:hypothetical protein